MFIIYILTFILGMVIGSFLNVVIYRLPRKESIVYPPSHCPKCGERLKPFEMIPVVSYLFLKGQCSNCGNRISIRYPIVELLTGICYTLVVWKFGVSIDALFYSVLISVLIAVSFIDAECMLIPNKLVLFGLVAGIIFRALNYTYIKDYIVGILLGAGFLLLISILVKGSMGMGDVKLMGMIALYIDWKLVLITLLLSFIIGAVISIILVALKIKGRKDYVPFGPFISIAAFISLMYGYHLMDMYLTFIRR